ncbi:hypothetical protein CCR75_004507 [Bremia lactucae]|uniref:HTH CENPB-type domain-containing protein n=1 Tax=Bremia lactucae TaxID=4779 RepID=A0A976FK61_BRELC|nr:hypothetical protein CCR75_004507 [Bremia lactucae]
MKYSDLKGPAPSNTTAGELALGITKLPTLPSYSSGSTLIKRKRVVLSIHDKQQVLQRLEGGEQPMAIARIFGISRQQVSDIKKNKDRIVAFCTDAKHMSTLKRKTLKTTSEYHPGVEQELYRWLIRQRKLGRDVTAESLAAKTTDIFMQYSPDDAHITLKAASNWLRQFRKAHGIRSLTKEEIQQLPEKFTPAMEMTRPGNISATSLINSTPEMTTVTSGMDTESYYDSSSVTHPINAAILTASISPSVDINLFVHSGIHGYAHSMGNSIASLQYTLNTVQQLNALLAKFEREMETKLDYLDERVAKLCCFVISARLGVD